MKKTYTKILWTQNSVDTKLYPSIISKDTK